jgi:hypothetical protein
VDASFAKQIAFFALLVANFCTFVLGKIYLYFDQFINFYASGINKREF